MGKGVVLSGIYDEREKRQKKRKLVDGKKYYESKDDLPRKRRSRRSKGGLELTLVKGGRNARKKNLIDDSLAHTAGNLRYQ